MVEQVAQDAILFIHNAWRNGRLIGFWRTASNCSRGPTSVSLPFHQGSGRDWFPKFPFPPYRHRKKPFSTYSPAAPKTPWWPRNRFRQNRVFPVAGGYCRQQHAQAQRGIKAILIYPMNALATDQARRIAQINPASLSV